MAPQLIDSHCHLYLEAFNADIQQIIQRARGAGVSHFMLPAIDSSELSNLLQLEKLYPGSCIAMMGLHPCSVKENFRQELDLVQEWLGKRRFAAVGEIGLDYYWDKTFIAEQKQAFHEQIEAALQRDLPIVIHSRNAVDDCIEIVKEHQDGRLRGVFHCFSDGVEHARKIIDLGFYLGIGGVLTYKNSGLADTIKQLPLEHMVLETDAPYLTPVPFRGKRNESSYIKYVAEKLADVTNTSLEEVARITTQNSRRLFAIAG